MELLSPLVDKTSGVPIVCQPEMTDQALEKKMIGDLVAAADGAPADGLRAVVVLRRLADRVEAEQVGSARRLGWTWEEIGDALGVSRQAVHKKYRKVL